jgi:hypothetical protein
MSWHSLSLILTILFYWWLINLTSFEEYPTNIIQYFDEKHQDGFSLREFSNRTPSCCHPIRNPDPECKVQCSKEDWETLWILLQYEMRRKRLETENVWFITQLWPICSKVLFISGLFMIFSYGLMVIPFLI